MAKQVISKENLEEMLKDVNIKIEDMNDLVNDYLVTEGYTDTAERFQEDSGIEQQLSPEELELTFRHSERGRIKKAIECGNIDAARRMYDELCLGTRMYDQSCLGIDDDLASFRLAQQGIIELIRKKNLQDALELAREELPELVEQEPSLLEELYRTAALLIFPDVYDCPVKELMGKSQRLKAANDVNKFILKSFHCETESKLEKILRSLIFNQNQLDKRVFYPRINDLATAALEDPLIPDWKDVKVSLVKNPDQTDELQVERAYSK